MKLERAVIRAEVRAAGEGEGLRVVGLGVVYDKWEELWPGYRERILRGAVKLAPEVKSYFNHDPNMVLSTTASDPPLVVRETDQGYEYDSPIPPTSYGRDLIVNLQRRNVKGSSFTFIVPQGGDRWWEDENGVVHREIRELILYEIGPVTDPAFVSTTAAIRSSREALLQEGRAALVEPEKPLRIPDPEDVRRLVRHGELRATL
ncbi:MAG: hypothetical protein BAA04_10050 [Firmicutes bacterium ZCTH02-B6]|nr:MAG: hypothetical protein BAA04_10050 [Firmicutes bacterium ZCTH02-B6]